MNASHTTQGDTNIDITRRCLPRNADGIRRYRVRVTLTRNGVAATETRDYTSSVEADRVFNGHVAHFKSL
jgi:hypothetical protein